MNYQLKLLSAGGQGGKRTSSETDTDWDFAKKARLVSPANKDPIRNETPQQTPRQYVPDENPGVSHLHTSKSVDFAKNQNCFIDMEQLSGNLSTHLTCRKCAIKHANAELRGELPKVKFVVMGEYGAATKLGIYCETCDSVSTVHEPKTVCTDCKTPNAVTRKNTGKKSRVDDSTMYAINHQLVLGMQSLGLGCEGATTLLTFLGIGGSIHSWNHHSLFQRIEEMLAVVEHDITQESMDAALLEEMELTLIDEPEQLTKWNMTLEEWKGLSPETRKSKYRVNITVLYDMGWQKRNSGHNYDSLSGHAFMIGSHTGKIIAQSVLAKACQGCYMRSKGFCTDTEAPSITGITLELLEEIHEEDPRIYDEEEDDPDFYKENADQGSKNYIPDFSASANHICTKNYDGASKGMEATAFIRMVIDGYDNRGFIVGAAVADDDSSVRANAKHVDTSKKDDVGMLPDRVPEPKRWFTDANHFIRHVLKKIFGMTNTVGDGQNPTKFFARRLKDLLGCALRENAHLPFKDFAKAVRCVPNHLFDEHDDCGTWCKRKNDPEYDKGKYWDPVTYQVMKGRVWQALKQDLSDQSLRRVHHSHHTQLCEALQNGVAQRAPKNRTYSRTISLYGRVCITAGEHNMGKDAYIKELTKRMSIGLPESSSRMLEYKTRRKKKQRDYSSMPAQKFRRKKKEHQTMKEQRVKDEKSRATYGKKLLRIKHRKPRKQCGECRMLDHRSKASKACFANPANPVHETFKDNKLTALVIAGEAYVTQQKAKKRGREKKYQVPEELWKEVMCDPDLALRASHCFECVLLTPEDPVEGIASLSA